MKSKPKVKQIEAKPETVYLKDVDSKNFLNFAADISIITDASAQLLEQEND